METKKLLLFGLLCVLVMGVANASTKVTSTIKRYTIYPTNNIVYIDMLIDPSGKPACHTTTSYDYVFALDTVQGQALFSAFLAAYHAGTAMVTKGTGLCDLVAGVETLEWIVANPI